MLLLAAGRAGEGRNGTSREGFTFPSQVAWALLTTTGFFLLGSTGDGIHMTRSSHPEDCAELP